MQERDTRNEMTSDGAADGQDPGGPAAGDGSADMPATPGQQGERLPAPSRMPAVSMPMVPDSVDHMLQGASPTGPPPPGIRGVTLAARFPTSARVAVPEVEEVEPPKSPGDLRRLNNDDLLLDDLLDPLPSAPEAAVQPAAAPVVDEPQPPTWRSKSRPPRSIEPSVSKTSSSRVSSEPRKRAGLRNPPPDLIPGFDLDNESMAAVAPIGPTESVSSRLGTPTAPPRPATPPPAPATNADDIEHQIQDLEARLDQMIQQSREKGGAPLIGPGPSSEREPRAPVSRQGEEPDSVTARELLSTDFYLRQWGRLGMRNRSEEVDEFGLDPKYEARYKPFFDFLYKHYFRADTTGTENIPNQGRCLIVSNHSGGALPYDGVMLRTALRHDHPEQRELRWLAEDFIYYLPFVGAVMNRLGAVRACQENAERLLGGERLVAVFPEGAKGIGKLYKERYRLQRFGRGGFIRLCLRTQTPLVPCAIVGAEEANPMLYRIERMTKAFGIPYLPITPTFPALGPLGLLPAPTKWKIRFGEILRFDGYGPEAADDDILVGRLAERVRSTIQGLIDKVLAERQSIWFG